MRWLRAARPLWPVVLAGTIRCAPISEPIRDSMPRSTRDDHPTQSGTDAGAPESDSGVDLFPCHALQKKDFTCNSGPVSGVAAEGELIPFGDYYLRPRTVSEARDPSAFIEIQDQFCSLVAGQSYLEGDSVQVNLMNGPHVSISPRVIRMEPERQVQVTIIRDDCPRACVPGQTSSETVSIYGSIQLATPLGDLALKLEGISDTIADLSIQDGSGNVLWNLHVSAGTMRIVDFWSFRLKLTAWLRETPNDSILLILEPETCTLR